MGALKLAAMAAMLAVATPAHADPIDRWRPLIAEASARSGVPASWIERVMRAESRGLTVLGGRPITSRAGAMGLMQLMPATWATMRRRLGLGDNPHDPHDNVMAGSFYLSLLYYQFGYPGLFGAYNAGPGRYGAWLTGTRRLPVETVAYMAATAADRPPPLEPTGAVMMVRTAIPAARPRIINALFFPRDGGAAMSPQPALFVALTGSRRTQGD